MTADTQAREELRKLLDEELNRPAPGGWAEYIGNAADAILAAGYRRPATAPGVEGLREALRATVDALKPFATKARSGAHKAVGCGVVSYVCLNAAWQAFDCGVAALSAAPVPQAETPSAREVES